MSAGEQWGLSRTVTRSDLLVRSWQHCGKEMEVDGQRPWGTEWKT